MSRLQEVTHLSEPDEYPTGALPAEEMVEKLKGAVTTDDLLMWAEARAIPHWRINGGTPLFKVTEVKRWLSKNAVERIEGGELPLKMRIAVDSKPHPRDVPRPLMFLNHLCRVQVIPRVSGVYFLIKDGEIAYVGQSVNVMGRISEHASSKKQFDSALYLPLPQSALRDVERFLIKALRPPLNIELWREIPITSLERTKAQQHINIEGLE